MNLLCGTNVSEIVDYSFGDHHVAWDKTLKGVFEPANISNAKFLVKVREFEGWTMTLFIDNIRLYPRAITLTGAYAQQDAQFIKYLMDTNDLLSLCAQLPKNKFIIFTGEEDTPINDQIKLPDNVLKIYAVNALYNTDRIIPFPFGLQRQRGENDDRLLQMSAAVTIDIGKQFQPTKLLYINCGIERNPERLPLAQFETNDWCTTRFDKDSMFFPYDRYSEFLSELRDHKFVVCPKGHGYDTHRIWETLYMRRVPIIKRDPYFFKLFETHHWPVLWVDDWKDITPELLSEQVDKWVELDMKELDLDYLYQKAIK